MNFLKQTLANLQTGNQFVIGFQAGFALTLLGILLINYLPLGTNNKEQENRVLAAEIQVSTKPASGGATQNTSPSGILTPTPTKFASGGATLTPTPTINYKKIIIITTPTKAPTGGPIPNSADESVNSLLNMINSARTAHGAIPLVLDQTISACALAHSQQMASTHSLSHNLAGDACAAGYHAMAENIGESTQTPNQAIITIHNSMMNEGPGGGHYENIINPVYSKIGIGIYFDGTTTWITEDFEG